MILSASRRTDIPAFYMEWFLKRLKEGWVLTKNPMNPSQVGRVRLDPSTVDCIVFWTKNPEPMMKLLDARREARELLRPYPFYIQYTLNDYGPEIEGGLPPLEERIQTFQSLSKAVGKNRVLWRYDPILMGGSAYYSVDYHIKHFSHIAKELEGCTERCTLSFLDLYRKNIKAAKRLGIRPPEPEEIRGLAEGFSDAAGERLRLFTCAERASLEEFGIGHGACIDPVLIESLLECRITAKPEQSKRQGCGCMASVDVGTYNTCLHGCAYCYANDCRDTVKKRAEQFDTDAPILCDTVQEGAVIREREMKSLKSPQYVMEFK